MKIEWLVTDALAIGFPGRAERAVLGVVLAGRVFANSWPIQVIFVAGEPLCCV